jgi:hypothetical protein
VVIGGLPIVAFAILNNGPAIVGVVKITVQVVYGNPLQVHFWKCY